MKKILSAVSALMIVSTAGTSVVACGNTTNNDSINDYTWTAEFSSQSGNSSWIEQASTTNLQVPGVKYKFKKFDFSSVLPLYEEYAREWFATNNLEETTEVTTGTDASGAQDSVAGATSTEKPEAAFLMGYIANSRSENAVANSIKNKNWESVFKNNTAIANKFNEVNYFYLQAPNGGAAKDFTADANNNITVPLNVYFLSTSKSITDKVNVNKIESETLNFEFQVPN